MTFELDRVPEQPAAWRSGRRPRAGSPRWNAWPSAEKSPDSDSEVPIVIGLALALLEALLAELVAPPPPLLLLELLPFEELPQAATTMTAPSASPDVRHLRRILIPSPSALVCRPVQERKYRGTAIVCKVNVAVGRGRCQSGPDEKTLMKRGPP